MQRRDGGLRIYRSNSMEKLAEALGDSISEPPEDALAPECILVPGRGIAQWLSTRLCERFGVSANVLYLYPRNFVGWALDRVLAKPGETLDAFEPDKLAWALFSAVEPLLELPEFALIQRYVAGDPTRVRYFELCRRIAATFDRYVTYRPDLLESWERRSAGGSRGADAAQLGLFSATQDTQSWQPILWRALVARLGTGPTGTLERRFSGRLARAKKLENLPPRISCLGLTHLPPSYTRILVALCPHVRVDVFQLQASAHSAASPSRVISRSSAGAPGAGRERAANPLLRSLGTLAFDFERVLDEELSQKSLDAEVVPLHIEPRGDTRLSRLQRDLLHDRPPEPAASPTRAEPDDSVRIHACHSAMREVEVLHDQLLSLLAHDRGIEPRDIVVMMPDVEVYAPLIEAVFRRRDGDAQRIPYSIADRTVQTSAPVVDALARVFKLVSQRLTASQLLDVLALDVVAAHFGITPKDVERMTEWLVGVNVRWGKDAAHRTLHHHPASDANTWRLGLRRLLLGYAVESDGTTLLSDTLPEGSSLGSEAAALGKLAQFVETLFAVLDAFEVPQSAESWSRTVGSALDALTENDAETAWQHREVRDAALLLSERARSAGFSGPISAPAFAELLFDAINAARPSRGFLMGGVTFCSMVLSRTVPFKVVCLMGLGDGEFPRRESVTDFDLISLSSERRVGDRSRRIEDRYAFLEAILAARERLIITFVGQSIRDNTALPPSVLVSELCEYLGADVSARSSQSCPGTDILVRHPLQAFSPRYFDGSDARLFSYASTYLEGARRRGEGLGDAPPFFPDALTALPPPDVLPVTDLIRFYQNPTEFLLNQRLELFLREHDLAVPDREPQELSPLELYGVGQRLLELMLREVPLEVAKRAIMAGGALPLGAPGELDFLEATASARPIADAARAARSGERRAAASIEKRLASGVTLVGTSPESYGGCLVTCQFARVRARHLLDLWIRHLVHCWCHPELESTSSLFGRPSPDGEGVVAYRLRPVTAPEPLLEQLVRRFHEGQRAPLRFFPTASQRYAELSLAGKPEHEALGAAQRIWLKECGGEPHYARVFGKLRSLAELPELEPEAPGFEELSRELMTPLLSHLSTQKQGS